MNKLVPCLLLSLSAVVVLTIALQATRLSAVRAQESAPGSEPLQPPAWKVGDTWTVETVSHKIQGREDQAARNSPKLQWKFHVDKIEPVAGRDCYRIDIQCLAKGRLQPATTIWCDQETRFLRQFQTQLPAAGQFVVVQESYATQQRSAPVLPPVTALPLGLPVFVQQGAKDTGPYVYTSQPLPAGSKDAGVMQFAHTTQQQVQPPSSKSLKLVKGTYAKDIEQKTIQEVHLSDENQSVVQIWQAGAPWPVYASNGHTEAWLVSDSTPSDR